MKKILLISLITFFTCSSFSCEKEKVIPPQQEQTQQPKMTVGEAEKLIIGTWIWYKTPGGKATGGKPHTPQTCNCTGKLVFHENKQGEEYWNDTLRNAFTYEIRYGMSDADNTSSKKELFIIRNDRTFPEHLVITPDSLFMGIEYMDGLNNYYYKVKF